MVWFLMGLALVLTAVVSFLVGVVVGVASTFSGWGDAERRLFEEGL